MKTVKLEVVNDDLEGALRTFFRTVLAQADIRAILVPWRLPMKNRVMPTLISDPDHLDRADALSPSFPVNSAKIVSRLTRKPSGGKIAAVMRPCEIRAFVELVKLKQGQTENLITIGIDCLGAYANRDFFRFAEDGNNGSTKKFYTSVLAGKGGGINGLDLAPACRVCEIPVARGADVTVGLYGIDLAGGVPIRARTVNGEALLEQTAFTEWEEPPTRRTAVDQLIQERVRRRDVMFETTHGATGGLERLTGYLANCTNCYNCRVACPVCYCRECVFVTDVFDHEPAQYLQWADRKGVVKMPTDTVFYHLTRLAHMSTACVGCGQCSNACPNDVPVMELFRMVADRTQRGFQYQAGRSFVEKPPLSEFREDEFQEVVG